ncbi:MAG TPA: hypothetical protein VJB67_00905 [Patescibacteria group bacterium]|nr:hypothetical protein [Patescibacteria group bacterium]
MKKLLVTAMMMMMAQAEDKIALTEIGRFSADPAYTGCVAIKGKVAFSGGPYGMDSWDIRNPRVPKQLCHLDLWNADDIVIRGPLAYVETVGYINGVRVSGFAIVDISHPKQMSVLGWYDQNSNSSQLEVRGKYLYLADYASGLVIVDVSDPADPRFVGQYDPYTESSDWVLDVKVRGHYAYLACGYHGMEVVDISNPAAPELVGVYDGGHWGYAFRVEIKGQFALLGNLGTGLDVVNISDPAMPYLVGNWEDGSVWSTVLSNGLLFIVDYSDQDPGVKGLDLSDPSNPNPVCQFSADGGRGVAVEGNILLFAGNQGVSVLKIQRRKE